MERSLPPDRLDAGAPQPRADGPRNDVIPAAASDPGATAIKVSSRVGVWGLVGGFVAVILSTLGFPLPMPAAIGALAAGLGVGGAGIATASVLVRRRSPKGDRLLRATCTLGAVLGGMLSAIGVATLLGFEWVGAAGGAATAALGIVVLVLLVTALVVRFAAPDER